MFSYRNKEKSKPTFPDFSVGNIVCCGLVIWASSSAWEQFLLSIYLPEDQWYPTPLLIGAIFLMLSLFIIFAFITSLAHVPKFLSIPVEEEYRFIYITEAIFAGLFFLSLIQIFHMDTKIRYLFQARDTTAFQKLEVGMSKEDVEALIVEANLTLIGPPRDGWFSRTSDSHYRLYLRLEDALQTARTGGAIDFSDFDEREIRLSIFRLAQRDDEGDLFRRIYKLGVFSDDDYDYRIVINYDDTDKLRWARYERADGGIMPCAVLHIGEAPIPQVPWRCPLLDGY